MFSLFSQESCSVRENGSPGAAAASTSKTDHSSEATIADLLDLEYELNNMQQNAHHMDHISSDQYGPTGSKDDIFGNDPFGDSFTGAAAKSTKTTTVAPLPPPPSAKDSSRPDGTGTGTHRRERTVNRAGSTTTAPATVSAPFTSTTSSFGATAPLSAPLAQEEKHWFDQETEALFDESELAQTMQNTTSSRLEQVHK